MTSRELVLRTLEFDNKNGRAPRQLWALPWAESHYPKELAALHRDFPGDITEAPATYAVQPRTQGDAYAVGEYTDEWGCVFENLHEGIIGEVKAPIIHPDDEDWDDLGRVHIPTEELTFDAAGVNAFCAAEERFVMAGCCPRPFERLQFLRGTEALYMDLVLRPPGMLRFIEKLHAFYCEQLEAWAKTDVDGIGFMDDWGSQNTLLISPDTWAELFKPLYKDYIDIIHRHGKKAFMHSDGHTLAIYPHMAELGLDAFNSQIFCIGVEKLAPFKGKITFWGEIDRQHLLPEGTPADIDAAVARVRDTLWENGGCIAQCEFGPGARPENVRQVFASWDRLTTREGTAP